MAVDILKEAVSKYKTAGALQRELVRHGVDISEQAISQAIKKNAQSIRLDVLSALVVLVFQGNWKAAGKIIDGEHGKDIS